MSLDERMETIQSIVSNMAQVLGPNTEIAVYDLRENGITQLENGSVSGRTVGYIPDPVVLTALDRELNEKGVLVGMIRHHRGNGKVIRISHFLLKLPDGIPYARICIQQDITDMYNYRNSLSAMIGDESKETWNRIEGENLVQQACQSLIMEEIKSHELTNFQNKEVRARIIASLYRKGIFDIKTAVPQVCSMLNISQTTLYNLLRDIRAKGLTE